MKIPANDQTSKRAARLKRLAVLVLAGFYLVGCGLGGGIDLPSSADGIDGTPDATTGAPTTDGNFETGSDDEESPTGEGGVANCPDPEDGSGGAPPSGGATSSGGVLMSATGGSSTEAGTGGGPEAATGGSATGGTGSAGSTCPALP